MDGEISGPELESALATDPPLIVDIRPPGGFQHHHIEGSINIPISELPQQIERLSGADHVVTVCPHGEASVRAARLIASFEGFQGRVESLSCGLEGWEGPVAGHAVDTESDADASSQSPL